MISDIQFNPSAIRAYDCIGEGWDLIKPNFGLFLGITLVGLIIGGCIPCVSIFLAGPIAVGIFFTLFTEMRGQPVEFGMMFKGFERFVPAMAVGIVQAIPEIIGNGLRFGVQISDLGRELQRGGGAGRGSQFFLANQFAMQSAPDIAFSSGLVVIAAIVGIGIMLFAIAWRITFFFALPLIAEYNLSPVEAMKLSARAGWSNWGGIFILGIFQGLVALVGVLMLCIGVFLVMPIIQASNAIAFRQVFPDQQKSFNNEPPRPDVYGSSFGTGL
jgi:uncharacterized membrane protein YesL